MASDMMMNNVNIVVKFLTGEASKEEIELLDVLLKEPANRKDFEELSSLWFALQEPKHTFNKEAARQKYRSFLVQKVSDVQKRKTQNLRIQQLLKYVALFVGVGLGVYFILMDRGAKESLAKVPEFSQMNASKQQEAFIRTETGEIVVLGNDDVKSLKATDGTQIQKEKGEKVVYQNVEQVEEKAVIHELGVPRGKRIDLVLADGTKVWLNSESVLKYPTKFNEKERIVLLEGEAYFEVAKNAKQAFIVKTSDLNIRVLGTRFNVCSYQTAATIDVALVEGKIAFYDRSIAYEKKKAILLRPNHRAVFNKNTNLAKLEECDAEIYCSWRTGKLQFNKEPFDKLKIRLERWYDVDIKNENSMLEKLAFSGEFDNEDIFQAMETLRKNTGIHYEKIENTIRILPQ